EAEREGTVARGSMSILIGQFFLAARLYDQAKCGDDLTRIDSNVDPSAASQRQYAKILKLEANALSAMGGGYGALKSESDYDEAADASDAIGGAAKAVTVLAQAALPASSFVPIG